MTSNSTSRLISWRTTFRASSLAVALLLLAFSRFVIFPSWQAGHLTNRSSQPPTGEKSLITTISTHHGEAGRASVNGGSAPFRCAHAASHHRIVATQSDGDAKVLCIS